MAGEEKRGGDGTPDVIRSSALPTVSFNSKTGKAARPANINRPLSDLDNVIGRDDFLSGEKGTAATQEEHLEFAGSPQDADDHRVKLPDAGVTGENRLYASPEEQRNRRIPIQESQAGPDAELRTKKAGVDAPNLAYVPPEEDRDHREKIDESSAEYVSGRVLAPDAEGNPGDTHIHPDADRVIDHAEHAPEVAQTATNRVRTSPDAGIEDRRVTVPDGDADAPHRAYLPQDHEAVPHHEMLAPPADTPASGEPYPEMPLNEGHYGHEAGHDSSASTPPSPPATAEHHEFVEGLVVPPPDLHASPMPAGSTYGDDDRGDEDSATSHRIPIEPDQQSGATSPGRWTAALEEVSVALNDFAHQAEDHRLAVPTPALDHAAHHESAPLHARATPVLPLSAPVAPPEEMPLPEDSTPIGEQGIADMAAPRVTVSTGHVLPQGAQPGAADAAAPRAPRQAASEALNPPQPLARSAGEAEGNQGAVKLTLSAKSIEKLYQEVAKTAEVDAKLDVLDRRLQHLNQQKRPYKP